MNTHFTVSPLWSTASFGDAAETSTLELSALADHLGLCKGLNGRLFALRCAAETMNGFVTTRFVTTLVAVTLLIGVSSLVV